MNFALARLHALRAHLGPLWWHAMVMFIVSRAGDVVSLYIGMFLVPDRIATDQLGAVIPMLRVISLVGIPLGILGAVATKFVNVMLVRGETGRIKAFLRDFAALSTAIAAVLVLVLWLTWDFIALRLKVDDRRLLPMIALLLALGCWGPIANTVAQGLKHFYRMSLAKVIGPLARLAAVVVLLTPLGLTGYLAGQVAASLAGLALIAGPVVRYVRQAVPRASYRELLPEMLRYGMPLALTTLAITLQQTVEVWVIRQRLSEADSAGYYVAAMFGVIPMWVAPAMTPFLFPLVSERFERGESTRRMHLQSIGVIAAIGIGIALLFLFLGGWLLDLRPKWRLHAAYAPYMWVIAVVATLDQLLGCHFVHENACRRFTYLRWLLPILLLSSAGLYVLMGWSFLEGWLPERLWRAVDGCCVRDMTFVVRFVLAVRVLCLGALAVDVVRFRDGSPTITLPSAGAGG